MIKEVFFYILGICGWIIIFIILILSLFNPYNYVYLATNLKGELLIEIILSTFILFFLTYVFIKKWSDI